MDFLKFLQLGIEYTEEINKLIKKYSPLDVEKLRIYLQSEFVKMESIDILAFKSLRGIYILS